MLKKFFELLNTEQNEADKRAQLGLSKLNDKKSLSIGAHRVKIDRKIAEGGYADIYRVIEVGTTVSNNEFFGYSNNQVYALKRMFISSNDKVQIRDASQLLADNFQTSYSQQRNDSILGCDYVRRAYEMELAMLQNLKDCPNVIQLVDHQENAKDGGQEVYLLLEYCPHGTLFDLIEEKLKQGFIGITDEAELMSIIADISTGLAQMHQKQIAHRDLKIENILKNQDSKWTICDFGSSTVRSTTGALSVDERQEIMEEIEKVTTPIYRAPEQIDLYRGLKLTPKVDVWALGCIMYTLMYFKPPFQDGEKLAQMNGNYRKIQQPQYSQKCLQLLDKMLTVNPDLRLTSAQVLQVAQGQSMPAQPNQQNNPMSFNFPNQDVSQAKQFDSIIESKPQNLMQENPNYFEHFVPPNEDNQNRITDYQYSIFNPETDRRTMLKAPQQPPQINPAQQVLVQQQKQPQAEQQIQFKEDELYKRYQQIFQAIMTEDSECIPEKVLRQFINFLHELKDLDPCSGFYDRVLIKYFNSPVKIYENTVVAIKFLVISSRLQMYAPKAFTKMKDLNVYKNMFQQWKGILDNQIRNSSDQFRCNFFCKLIAHVSSHLESKIEMVQQYQQFIDTGYNLTGIVEPKTTNKTPLQMGFLTRLNVQWRYLTAFNTKVFEPPYYIKSIRTQLAIILMEEQYQLMCTISHLFLALQVSIELQSSEMDHNVRQKALNYINNYKTDMQANVESLHDFILEIQQQNEAKHLVDKIPFVPIDLCFLIEDQKVEMVKEIRQRNRGAPGGFDFNMVIHIDSTIKGMQSDIRLPIPFRVYKEFVTAKNMHDKHDFVLTQKAYRDKLGKLYQTEQLKNRTSQAHVVANNVGSDSLKQFRSRFQSVSQNQFDLVRSRQSTTKMNQQLQSPLRSSTQSSDIEIILNPANINKKNFSSIGSPPVFVESGRNTLNSDQLQWLAQDNLKGSFLQQQNLLDTGTQGSDTARTTPGINMNQVIQQKEETKVEQANDPAKMSYEEQLAGVFAPANQPSNSSVVTSAAQQAPAMQAQGQGQGQAKPRGQQSDFLLNWNNQFDEDDDEIFQRAEYKSVTVQPMDDAANQDLIRNSLMNRQNTEVSNDTQTPYSQFDSRASDYFLLLNQKNQSIVDKRKDLKLNYTNDVLEYEQIFADSQKAKIEREYTLIQRIQEEQIKRQSIIMDTLKQKKESEKQMEQQQNELKRLQTIVEEEQLTIQKNKTQMEKQKKELDGLLQSKEEKLKKEREEFENERKKFDDYKKLQYSKITEEKKKLQEINQVLEKKKQDHIQQQQQSNQQSQEAQILAQKIAELELKNKEYETMMSKMSEEKKVLEEQKKQAESNSAAQSTNSTKATSESANKEENLAVGFLKQALHGREDLNVDLKQIMNPTQIGEGAAAIVYKAQYKFTDVAVKKLKAQSLIVGGKLSVEFQREVETLTQISHPNLVLFMGATADQGHPVIITEFCKGGTLFELLHEKKKTVKLSFKQRHKMMLDIAKGMHFMHGLKSPLMHRDLKSLNLLLAEEIKGPNDLVQAKITDFGLSRKFEGSDGGAEAMMTGQAGTFHWMAPEVLENSPYTQKADVYSFGIVMWEILAREPPFATHSPQQIIYGVVNHKERPPLTKIPVGCPKELTIIMRACWEQDPKKRPNFSDVCQGLSMLKIEN